MNPVVGLELTGNRIRAITVSRLTNRALRRFDIPWNPAEPDRAVGLLRENLGAAGAICVAIGFDFLYPKHIKLPPVTAAEKRRMVALEPERFFPVSAPVIVSAGPGASDLVFATDAVTYERWITALVQWGPIQNVEASPAAFARAARSAGVPNGVYRMSSSDDSGNYVEISRGAVVSARRAGPRGATVAAHALPDSGGVPGEFMAAYGAALGVGSSPGEMLVSEEMHRRLSGNRIRSLAIASVLVITAVGFALFSGLSARGRLQERIDSEVAALRPRAAMAEALQGRIARIGSASAAAKTAQGGMDPLAVLGVLSKRLPRDVVVMSIRGTGDEWQISGTAKDAAAIIPALDSDPAIKDVRFLAGTSRFTEGRRTYETFSIGFRASPST